MSVESPCSCSDRAGSGYSTAILRGVAVQGIPANVGHCQGGVKSEMTLCLICHNSDILLGTSIESNISV